MEKKKTAQKELTPVVENKLYKVTHTTEELKVTYTTEELQGYEGLCNERVENRRYESLFEENMKLQEEVQDLKNAYIRTMWKYF